MQFAENEDLATYPRTMDADLAALREAGVDMVFTPNVEDIYPGGSALHTAIHVPVLGDSLCGRDRPGHFDGVCTVVCKLFQIVEPDIAVFGEKDLQQLLIIKQMVSDLGLPVEVQHGPTQRAEDGLALSSRNQYLSDAERALAPLLWQTLQDCAQALSAPAISEADACSNPGPGRASARRFCRRLSGAAHTIGFRPDPPRDRRLRPVCRRTPRPNPPHRQRSDSGPLTRSGGHRYPNVLNQLLDRFGRRCRQSTDEQANREIHQRPHHTKAFGSMPKNQFGGKSPRKPVPGMNMMPLCWKT